MWGGVDMGGFRSGACVEPLRGGLVGSGPLFVGLLASFCETLSRSLWMSAIPEERALSWLEVT